MTRALQLQQRVYALAGAVGMRLERHYSRAQLAWLADRGARIGDGVLAFGTFHFHGKPENLTIGPGCTINSGVVLNASGPLVIGCHVRLSNHVQIQTDELDPNSTDLHREHRHAGVTIGDGAWLASGCVVVPGVRVGRRAITAAGAVVIDDVPDETLVAGVPAKVIRRL